MRTRTALYLSVLVVAPLGTASLAGCTSDKNKQLEEASVREAEAARQQREAQIDLQRKQEIQAIESKKPSTEGMPRAAQERAKAQAEVVEDRQKFQADAHARVQKAEARLGEYRQKIQIAKGNAPTAVHDQLERTSRMAESIANDINHLPLVTNDEFPVEKKRIEARLDELDANTDSVKASADAVRK